MTSRGSRSTPSPRGLQSQDRLQPRVDLQGRSSPPRDTQAQLELVADAFAAIQPRPDTTPTAGPNPTATPIPRGTYEGGRPAHETTVPRLFDPIGEWNRSCTPFGADSANPPAMQAQLFEEDTPFPTPTRSSRRAASPSTFAGQPEAATATVRQTRPLLQFTDAKREIASESVLTAAAPRHISFQEPFESLPFSNGRGAGQESSATPGPGPGGFAEAAGRREIPQPDMTETVYDPDFNQGRAAPTGKYPTAFSPTQSLRISAQNQRKPPGSLVKSQEEPHPTPKLTN